MTIIGNTSPKTTLPTHEQAARTRRASFLRTHPPAPPPPPAPPQRFIPGWRLAYLYGAP